MKALHQAGINNSLYNEPNWLNEQTETQINKLLYYFKHVFFRKLNLFYL